MAKQQSLLSLSPCGQDITFLSRQLILLDMLQGGQEYIFTIRDPETVGPNAIGVSYDAFVDDINVGSDDLCCELHLYGARFIIVRE